MGLSAQKGQLIDLLDKIEKNQRQVVAMAGLLTSAANDQQLHGDWAAALDLLRDRIEAVQVLHGQIKGAMITA